MNVTLYHGTSELAWRSIQREGRLRPIDFRDAARDTAKVFGLTEDEIWDSVYFEFERGRHHRKDKGVYLSVHPDTGKAYHASESYIDAAKAALAQKPGGRPHRDVDVAIAVQKVCGKPVLLTLEVPWEIVRKHANERDLPMETWLDYKRGGAGTVVIDGSVDAMYVVSADIG